MDKSFQEWMEFIKKWAFRAFIAIGVVAAGYFLVISIVRPEWANPMALRNFVVLTIALFVLVFVVCLIWFIVWFLAWLIKPKDNFYDAFHRETNENSRPGVFWGFIIALIALVVLAALYCLIKGIIISDFGYIIEFFKEFIESFSQLMG